MGFEPCSRRVLVSVVLLSSIFALLPTSSQASGGEAMGKFVKIIRYTGVIIPGFASSRLKAWSHLDCPMSPLDFNTMDSVWLDTKKVLGVPQCWLKCISLEPYNQTDNPECKCRPDWGIPAISELDPGYITGPLSMVWKEWVDWCIEFGLDPSAVVAAPYDWRLPPKNLEERDLYFSRLRFQIESAVKLRGAPTVIFAHSMGNNVFRYFLEWMKHQLAPKQYQEWIDKHIVSYFAVGAPLLGSPEVLKSLIYGLTFGLPITEVLARQMGTSFGATHWMLPFSSKCQPAGGGGGARPGNMRVRPRASAAEPPTCVGAETNASSSGWPMDVVTFDIPKKKSGIFPSVSAAAAAAASGLGGGGAKPTHTYTPAQVAAGDMFRDLLEEDGDAKRALHVLESYYQSDSILNPLTAWDRPPIKNVYCVYGIDLKTEVSYHFKPSGKEFPANWQLVDAVVETEGGELQTESGVKVTGKNKFASSGDVTVPYVSLSYCKDWLGPSVNITRMRGLPHEGEELQIELNVPHEDGVDVVPKKMKRTPGLKYVTFYEDSESFHDGKTAVWELDKVDHREIVMNPIALREMWLELLHEATPEKTRPFVSKSKRVAIRDEDCTWNYKLAKCDFLDRCEYRYAFGDVHLSQSCRLKQNIDDNEFLAFLKT